MQGSLVGSCRAWQQARAQGHSGTPATPAIAFTLPVCSLWQGALRAAALRKANPDNDVSKAAGLTDKDGQGEQRGVAELAPPLLGLPPVVVHKVCRAQVHGKPFDSRPQGRLPYTSNQQCMQKVGRHRDAGGRTAWGAAREPASPSRCPVMAAASKPTPSTASTRCRGPATSGSYCTCASAGSRGHGSASHLRAV